MSKFREITRMPSYIDDSCAQMMLEECDWDLESAIISCNKWLETPEEPTKKYFEQSANIMKTENDGNDQRRNH